MDEHLPLQLKQTQISCEGCFYCLAWEGFCFEYSLLTDKTSCLKWSLKWLLKNTPCPPYQSLFCPLYAKQQVFLKWNKVNFITVLGKSLEKRCLWFICEERTSCILGKNTFSSKFLSFVVHCSSQSKTKHPPIDLKYLHSILFFLELWSLH